MKIMVFAVSAEKGGALSILEEFYKEVKGYKNKNIKWIFVLSNPLLQETKNIKIFRYPWIKKSWFHRLYFDLVIARKLVKQYHVDKIFSLQNVLIPRINCEQILYVHQPLPFVDHKFSFKENKLFWLYQNIIGRLIFNSIKKASRVIVQTEWMKIACIDKTLVKSNKIEVIPPKINLEVKKHFVPERKSFSTFFYPASGAFYKNHRVIIEACRCLNKIINNTKYEIIFTLKGDESPHIKELYKQVQKEELPIRFDGPKKREEVFDLYTKSILIFPSYIETFGMPLLEARMHKGIILAANLGFAREILNDYKNAKFFDAFNSKELCQLMYKYINNKENYIPILDNQSKEELPKLIGTILGNN